ncbi:MAG: PrsW family intramembrane metalloprotease [Patescibacteria group bacterium]
MFSNLTPDQIQQLLVVIALASAPALIWGIMIFRGRKTSRWPLFLAFFLGTLTVLPLMGLNYLWLFYPELDIYRVIEQNITEVHIAALITLAVVGITEEFVKSLVVRFIDKTKIGIQTINDAVKYSILAGLGFAFTENIFYFFYIWQSSGFVGLLFPLIFRSVFTVAAHMVFSGIFGYFYGIAKFANPIMEAKLWLGEKSAGVRLMSKFMNLDEGKAFQQLTLIKGLLIAMAIHTTFNFLLEFGKLVPTILIVTAGFLYLMYLLNHKAGAIVFAGTARASLMAKRNEDVVLELLGTWTKEGRYQDVVDICQRLLMRDPDNKVVQLFQAKAMDASKLKNVESAVNSLFKNEGADMDNKSLRALTKQRVLMEMLKEKTAQTAAPHSDPSSPPSNPAAQPHAPSIPKPSSSQ